MAAPQWDWRFASTPATDEYDAAALATLREQADRARRWLELWSEAIGMPLPAGNGSGGPWQRVAVLDRQARVGLLDIAAGCIAWTDSVAPSYVRRLALATSNAASPNQAGGAGATGDAVSQICLTYHMQPSARPVLSPLPRPVVVWIEYGLTTCYGSIGAAPSAGGYRSEWVRLSESGVECRPTLHRQWERVRTPVGHCTVAVAEAVRRAYPLGWLTGQARIEVREGGVHHAGCRGEAEWRVYGTAEERALVIPRLLAVHAAVAAAIVEYRTYQARVDAGLQARGDAPLSAPSDPLASPIVLDRLGRDAMRAAEVAS